MILKTQKNIQEIVKNIFTNIESCIPTYREKQQEKKVLENKDDNDLHNLDISVLLYEFTSFLDKNNIQMSFWRFFSKEKIPK